MPFAHLPEVLAEAEPIARLFVDAGHSAFLVGGVVRDLWLDVELSGDSDLDLTTDARPDQVKALLAGNVDALWTQGERFGTIGCVIGEREWEITTHRSESYDPSSRKPAVTYADRIDADLSRRDFTVNAMAISLPAGELIDPFSGAHDLAARRLRTPLSPTASFTDDPLRMLRAARFVATHELVPDSDVESAIATMAGRIDIVAAERLRLELDKLVVARNPSPGLALLRRTDLLVHIFPELTDVPDQRWRSLIERLPDVVPDLVVRLAALLVAVDPSTRRPRLDALRHPRHITRAAAEVAEVASALLERRVDSDAALRRLVARAPDSWWPGVELALALVANAQHDVVDGVRQRAQEMEADLATLGQVEEIPLSGGEVIDILGVEPGPVIGEAVEVLREHRYDEGPMTAAEASELLRSWWERRHGG